MNSKKILTTAIIIAAVLVCIGIVYAIFNNAFNQPNSGNGIYYSQQGDGKYLQFSDNKTFSYIYDPAKDTARITSNNIAHQSDVLSKGVWKQENNKIILQFEGSESTISFVEKDDYIYREDTIFRGITSDAKLLKNKYIYKESEDKYTEMWFLDDGTMSCDRHWDGTSSSRWGTYVRTDDILIVRYNDSPDVAHRFLVLENGISKDIYAKKEIK